jgi:quercetin dioxygenase-like cupin family protein
MKISRGLIKIGVAISATTAATIAVLPALATPNSGVSITPLLLGTFGPLDVKADKTGKWDLFLRSKGKTDVSADDLVIQAGGFTGWHTHPGPILVTIKSGTVVWVDGVACSATTYQAGDTFIEPANHLHNVRTATGVEFVGIQMRPTGTAGRIDAQAPENCSL